MKKHLHFKSFLKKHHCHGAKHLKQVFSPDMIDGNQYDRLINAVEDYANEKAKKHVAAAIEAISTNVKLKYLDYTFEDGGKCNIPVIDKETIIAAYPFDNIK